MPDFLTIDVEDRHRTTGNFKPMPEGGLAAAMERLLDLLAETKTSATFFVLGADAEKVRAPLKRCIREGHEVACHGMQHRRVDSLDPEAFRRDLRTALAVIQSMTGVPCRGYRAPWFSVREEMTWFFDVLAEEGVQYDSSLWMPVGQKAPAFRGVAEVPIRFAPMGPARIGILGGLSLRLLPAFMIARLFHRCATAGQSACVYLHPYDWTPTPGFTIPCTARAIRRRLFVSRTLPRLRWLAQATPLSSIALGNAKG
jgi:peptidoglycan/xylan/chitin deacetylase (PgdA/CDA1 family)